MIFARFVLENDVNYAKTSALLARHVNILAGCMISDITVILFWKL
jgi:hypothetical protein